MERVDMQTFNHDVLPGLLGGDPDKAETAVNKYFTKCALFKHPLFMVTGKDEIAHLYSFWARANTSMVPSPGVTQMWVEPAAYAHPLPESIPNLPADESLTQSVVLDLTYQTVPYLPIHSFFQLRHAARIVVMLHWVRCTDGKYRIARQEDLIQVDSMLSAFFPHFLSVPLVILTRRLMRVSGLFILYVLDGVVIFLRTFF